MLYNVEALLRKRFLIEEGSVKLYCKKKEDLLRSSICHYIGALQN